MHNLCDILCDLSGPPVVQHVFSTLAETCCATRCFGSVLPLHEMSCNVSAYIRSYALRVCQAPETIFDLPDQRTEHLNSDAPYRPDVVGHIERGLCDRMCGPCGRRHVERGDPTHIDVTRCSGSVLPQHGMP